MTKEFTDYWNRLLDANPILKQSGALVTFNSKQLKAFTQKAFNAGIIESAAECEMDQLLGKGNSFFDRIFGK